MLVIVGLIQYQPDVYSSSKFDSVGVILTRRSCLFFKAEFNELNLADKSSFLRKRKENIMEKLILNDSTEIDIQDGASLGIITTILADYSAFLSLASKLTKENLSHVTFQSGGLTSAEYYSMTLTEPNFYLTVRETGIEVTFGLRERTQEEIQEEAVAQAISYLSDEQALTVKELYTSWESDPVGYEYSMDNPLGLRRNFNGGLWKLKKSHAKQADWYPGADPTLWEQTVEGHE